MGNFYALEMQREERSFGTGKLAKITELFKHTMEFVLILDGILLSNLKLRLVGGMDLLNIGIEHMEYENVMLILFLF